MIPLLSLCNSLNSYPIFLTFMDYLFTPKTISTFHAKSTMCPKFACLYICKNLQTKTDSGVRLAQLRLLYFASELSEQVLCVISKKVRDVSWLICKSSPLCFLSNEEGFITILN